MVDRDHAASPREQKEEISMVISPKLQLRTYRNADSLGKGSRAASYGVWQSHFCSQTRLDVDYPLDILQ